MNATDDANKTDGGFHRPEPKHNLPFISQHDFIEQDEVYKLRLAALKKVKEKNFTGSFCN